MHAAPSTNDFDTRVLEHKLSVPQLHHAAVSRAGLIQAARSSRDCRVVGITAPAGYGKSTLLAEWASAEERRVGFVALDRFDDDPARLVQLLASVCGRMDPGLRELAHDVAGAGTAILARAAPSLAAAIRSSTSPFVLMVDNLNELQSGSCHDVLSVFIDGVPRESQLVTASRFEQPHLPRLRVSGDVTEIGAADLALDPKGARQIFSAQKLTLSPEEARVVTERTEGWPAGLYLAALISKENDGGLNAVTGDDRYVADYLYREAWSNQPDDLQRFLWRTSVLDQLCGPLCDAVAVSSCGAEYLHRMEASSLFIIPLDRRREWYRYHALFREFLFGELCRREPEAIEKLHLRAADWYEANGTKRFAVEHLLQTADQDRSSQLVSQLMSSLYQTGELATRQRWLATLGDAAIKRYPPLAVYAALGGLVCGEPAVTERWAAFLEGVSFTGPPSAEFVSFESGRALVRAAMCADGVEQMMRDAKLAVSEEPEWSGWRNQALWALGEAYVLVDDVERAITCLADACSTAVERGQIDVLIYGNAELGRLAMDRGDWQDGADRVNRALAGIDEYRMQEYASSLLAYSCGARLCSHRGDLSGARRYLVRAMRARPSATYAWPFLAVRLRTELGKLYLALGETTTARHLLREIDEILIHRPSLGTIVEEVEAFGRAIESASAGPSAGPLTPAELRVLPYLQTHLTLAAIAERLFVSRSTVNSQVTSIYRKLGVSSRPDAVSRATSMGLLGR